VRIPLSWLREYVSFELEVSELVNLLNFSGTKVEAVHQTGGSIAGVVAARVISIEGHPNADNLTLVDVQADGDVERVVCGARNIAVGDLVPYAKVGARLPESSITERKIRGEVSRGMLCSGRELGVGKDHSGILILPSDAVRGQDVTTLLGIDDTIVELELTPNRPDCMGMIGIAREVGALTGTEIRWPEGDAPAASSSPSPITVEIEDPKGCPRYVARYIEGLSVDVSPAWIASRLLAAGVRPVSNVVDVTNYVMLEMGHPLHPFDAANVSEGHIVVRRATEGETMTTLDGIDRRLEPADLLIADSVRPLAIAGVMGGEDSEVSSRTSAVILEAAYFDPASVARTSRRHQLRSEASARFERGMDPEAPPRAAARAVQLITKLAGGAASNQVIDEYPAPIERTRISLRPQRTSALLGVEIDASRQAEVLTSVDFQVSDAGDVLEVEAPSFRPDVLREVDLIEEVARLEGLHKLPATLPRGRVGGLNRAEAADRSIRRTLAALGLSEVWTSSFMSPRDLDGLGLPSDHDARNTIEVANPMSEEEKLMRTTLLPGLARAAAYNLARTARGAALFEIARVYAADQAPLPSEPPILGGIFAGRRREQAWNAPERKWDFFAAKGVIQKLFESLRVTAPAFAMMTAMPFHPTRAARISLADIPLGILGELHPDVCNALEVPEGTITFEMFLAPVLDALPGRPLVGSLARYPGTFIDLAVVVDADQDAAGVETAIHQAGGPETTSVRLFDVYRGPQVPEGKKSLAYALELQVPDRTLTDADALRVRERVMQELEARFSARLRA
jgi:phenylalanyl-tRNA synthetase beta chain